MSRRQTKAKASDRPANPRGRPFPPMAGPVHLPFSLTEKKTWTKPRQPGPDLSFDESPRVYIRTFGGPVEKPGAFEHAETDELLYDVLFRINEIGRRTVAGEQDAAKALTRLTEHAVRELNAIASQFPELLQPIARQIAQWPDFISLHPEFLGRNKRLLIELQVGQDTEVNVSQRVKWKSNRMATNCALSLVEYIRKKQEQLHWLIQLKTARKRIPKLVVIVPAYPPWVKECAKLPRLNRDTVDQWWRVAKEAFLEGIPHPENDPELRNLGITPSAKKTLYESEIRSLILWRIHAALKAVACK